MAAPTFGTLPYTTHGVPVTIELTMLAPYSTEGSSFSFSWASRSSTAPGTSWAAQIS